MINVKTGKLATLKRSWWYARQHGDRHVLYVCPVTVTRVHVTTSYRSDGTVENYDEAVDTDVFVEVDRNDLYPTITAVAKALWPVAVENYAFWRIKLDGLAVEAGEWCRTLVSPGDDASSRKLKASASDLVDNAERIRVSLQCAKDQCYKLCRIAYRTIPFPDFRDILKSHCASQAVCDELLAGPTRKYENHLHRVAVRGFHGKDCMK
jgi:hypothetical protein